MARKSLTLEQFIEKAKNIHGNKYDYSKVEYVNTNTKICIICPKHGEFNMLPSSHLLGQECPKCKGRGLNTDDVIELCKEIHGDKYDYSKVIFSKMHDKVKIICPIHGEFEQTLSKHISKKQGCPKCAIENRSNKRRSNINKLIEKANIEHNFKYDYSNVKFNNVNDKVEIICPKHGTFKQRFYDNIHGVSCPKCIHIKSDNEVELFNFIKEKYNDSISGDRTILNGKELDIFIPSKNIAIEYNGLRWHTEEFNKDKWYHLNKTNECLSKGIKLIQIFEDEYNEHKDIVYSKVKHLLNIDCNLPKIMGRKCSIKEIDKTLAKEFLNKYHIQGYARSTTYLGAFYGTLLVAVMTFIKEDKKSLKWELNRFASDYHYVCQGIGGKLFKYFITHFDYEEIKSFADRRWTVNIYDNLYIKLGFFVENVLKPDYRYVLSSNPKERLHKFNFRKLILYKKYSLPLSMTESKMVKELGYSKIWDCGLIKYVYKKQIINTN